MMTNTNTTSSKPKSNAKRDASIKSDIVAISDKSRSINFIKAQKYQLMSGVSVLGVATVLIGLSLSHLAHGIATATNSGPFDSWTMSIGIDAGFIATEMAILFSSTDTIRKQVEFWGKPTVILLVILSMLMNAFAFGSNAPNIVFAVLAAILGATIPALIYVLTRIAFVMLTTLKK